MISLIIKTTLSLTCASLGAVLLHNHPLEAPYAIMLVYMGGIILGTI